MKGDKVASGTHGKFIWDGTPIYEVASFEAKVTIDREEILFGIGKDSKINSLAGEGTYKIKKVYSRGKKKYLEAYKKGEDPRVRFTGRVKDPSTIGMQSETIDIQNAWLNELPLMNFEKGAIIEEEYSFGFNPEDTNIIDEILEL